MNDFDFLAKYKNWNILAENFFQKVGIVHSRSSSSGSYIHIMGWALCRGNVVYTENQPSSILSKNI